MRSLTVERKTRGKARVQGPRPSAKPSRRELPAVQPGTARRGKKSGLFARLADRLGLFIRRPMLALCGVLLVFVLLAALLASGVIGRGFHAIGRAFDTVMAD